MLSAPDWDEGMRSGTLGKVGNCQIGFSVHAASDTASCPLSWRLLLPRGWDGPEALERRGRCRVPDEEHHRPTWQLALDMLDELATLGLRPAACGLRPAACGLRPAACGLRPAACGLRPAACGLRPAACGLRPAACGLRPAACGLRYWSRMPVTGRTPTSVTAWRTGDWPARCRSRVR